MPQKTGFHHLMDLIVQAFFVLALAYGFIVLGMYLLQGRLLYHGGSPAVPVSETEVAGMSDIRLDTSDQLSIRAWYYPAKQSGHQTIVYFHGNAGTIADRAYKARWFLDHGLGVLLVEYRGFGGNPGHPSEQGLYADAEAARAFLVSKGVGHSDMAIYGESLGSGVAVELALRMAESGKPAGAVILEAPYTAIPEVAQKHYPYLPARWLVKDRFDSLSKIGRIKTPLLIFHGDDDPVIPQSFGRELFNAALEPKQALWVPNSHHTDPFDRGGAVAVIDFLSKFR